MALKIFGSSKRRFSRGVVCESYGDDHEDVYWSYWWNVIILTIFLTDNLLEMSGGFQLCPKWAASQIFLLLSKVTMMAKSTINVLCCCWECFSLLSPFMFVYLKCEWVLIWGSTGNLSSTSRLWGSVVLVMVMVMVFGKFWIGDNVVHDSTKRPIFCYLSSAVLLISARAPPLQRQRHIGSVWIWFRKDSTVIRFDEWTIPNRTYL